jgi:hypothetical protein
MSQPSTKLKVSRSKKYKTVILSLLEKLMVDMHVSEEDIKEVLTFTAVEARKKLFGGTLFSSSTEDIIIEAEEEGFPDLDTFEGVVLKKVTPNYGKNKTQGSTSISSGDKAKERKAKPATRTAAKLPTRPAVSSSTRSSSSRRGTTTSITKDKDKGK